MGFVRGHVKGGEEDGMKCDGCGCNLEKGTGTIVSGDVFCDDCYEDDIIVYGEYIPEDDDDA